MKIITEKSDRVYLYISAIVLIVSFSISYQLKLSDNYSESIRNKEKINSKQRSDINELEQAVRLLDRESEKLMLEADSLQASEEKYKLSYHEINKKLKNSIATYSSSNDDSKWRLFSKAINE
jgi:uncharacterized protein YlxW (UPF0749 family)